MKRACVIGWPISHSRSPLIHGHWLQRYRIDGSYTRDHTAGSYVFDAQGKVRLFTRYGSGAEALAHDLKLLLAQG